MIDGLDGYDESFVPEDENVPWYIGIGGLITFSTIIPLNIYAKLDEIAKWSWFWPFIGGLIGVFGCLVAYLLNDILLLDSLITATIIYAIYILLNGGHHIDGLLDLGDVLMAHGTPERKRKILKETDIGVGAITILICVSLLTIAALNSVINKNLFLAIIIAEIGAKMGLITCLATSQPFPEGTGVAFIEKMTPTIFLIMFIICIILSFFILQGLGAIGILGGVFGGAIISYYAKKNLNGTNGDVIGASNEFARMTSLIFLLISITWF